ncbi:MAG: large-conductance mechanosensitive channel [Chloroflexota bacterium]|nr:large conductance mechanosensitive channel protein MscL [Chloroflexota bacterium]NOG63768.1 large conductance mechanosensitive channel protein MscL [Chloroflexota bacterium]GIK64998.1 MAG: large-conductance mechanosensitive channel [Chloroflexota bacterium]
MINEFKKFILRGNVLDLAVGIIMGLAFGSIVNSLVNDIIMPPIGYILGDVDFTNLFITLSDGDYDSLQQAKDAGAATINYGVFINYIINFLIVAFALFLVVKAFNTMMERMKKAEEPAAPAGPTTEEKLVESLNKLNATLEKMQK